MKGGVFLIPNTIKDVPHSACEVELKGGTGEAIRTVSIGVDSVVVASLDNTPEISKVALEIVIPTDIILGANGFTDLDGITVGEVIVENWGGNLT